MSPIQRENPKVGSRGRQIVLMVRQPFMRMTVEDGVENSKPMLVTIFDVSVRKVLVAGHEDGRTPNQCPDE
jgi:hypothetical protein